MLHQNVEQNHNIKADKSFKKCDKICILEADTNKSKSNHEEIKFGHNKFIIFYITICCKKSVNFT